jgi:hypothetical protein
MRESVMRESGMDTGTKLLFAGICLVVIVGVFIGLATWLGWWPYIFTVILPIVLDIVLVIAAITTAVMVLALILAVLNLTRTITEIRDEVMPVLDALRSTSTAVRETAKTATSFGVSPAVRTASFVVGATELASVVFGRGKTRRRAQERQKRRAQYERDMARKGDLNGR